MLNITYLVHLETYQTHNKMKKISYLFVLIFITACAKLPIESITLADSIISEGQRMHELNVSLLNKIFMEKSDKIDVFIKDEYTPAFLENLKIPPETDMNEEFSKVLQKVVPKINLRRDMMRNALENQRIKLIEKLNLDYKKYEEATTALKNLIESNVKVNQERQKAFNKAANLTNNRIDLNQIESVLDNFILKSGNLNQNEGSLINDLNTTINSLIVII